MSRHIYETRYHNRNVEVVVGFDYPLRYFFMTMRKAMTPSCIQTYPTPTLGSRKI